MGAWGAGVFENDIAADWVFELEESDDLSTVEDALNDVRNASNDELDADICSIGLAAAEVVAALAGKASPSLPEEVVSWTVDREDPDETLVDAATEAAGAVLESSELRDLWEESDDFDSWKKSIEDLLERLK